MAFFDCMHLVIYFVVCVKECKIMPVQKKITGSYSVRKSTSQLTSKSISPSKRPVQGKCMLCFWNCILRL